MIEVTPTLLPNTLIVMLLAGLGWLPIWMQNPRRKTIALAILAAGIFCVALAGRVMLPFLPGIITGNGGILIAWGLIWTACRGFRGKRERVSLILAPALVWAGLCFMPWFQAAVSWRISIAGLLILVPLGLAAREIYLLRQGSLGIRVWTLAILGIQAVLVVGRSIWALSLPAAAAGSFWAIPDVQRMLLVCSGFALLLGPGLVALEKELSDLRHRDTARSDHVTGVANRRYFDEVLQRHANRAARQHSPLSLIMADADHFKEYNDFYGHPAGDKCLQMLAQTLVMACRPGDLVTRYGGEEFAILLPSTRSEFAEIIAERMLFKIRALHLPHASQPEGFVSISLGVATMVPNGDEMASADLIEAADQALYRAKREGRDRVCVAGAEIRKFTGTAG